MMHVSAEHIFIGTQEIHKDRMNDLNNEQDVRSGEGYRAGYNEGYRFGGCQAVLARIPGCSVYRRHLRVLYVPQGFEAIDGGVADALRALTDECIVASPDTMLQEAASHRPDLVLVMNALHVFPETHAEQIVQIRQMGIRTAVWFVDDPYFTEDTVRLSQYYDTVFTHELECVSLYREAGCRSVHYLPLAADGNLFRPLQVSREYQYDVCFIGNAFWNRAELFDRLAPFLQDKKVVIAGGHWDRLKSHEQLAPFVRNGWIPVEETVSFYNGAKIVVNIHRPTDAGYDNRNSHNVPGSSINPRTYEISGCGTLQITDIRQDLTSYYRPGYDIETFKDAEELQSKIAYYLAHEEERLSIAWRSLWTTRQLHTFTDRIGRLLSSI
ncbi:spore maturation protein CgeB [Fontibacillus phaseoli]|uniref:Spore maturation protein CgeB n=2 Tax=Fontibacillus phaseoli TaxID=1416533 RepID=A0A369BDY0_9BACL|nr:spore maturation protein CgeB [Fontibacillus phaseoli]